MKPNKKVVFGENKQFVYQRALFNHKRLIGYIRYAYVLDSKDLR